MAAHQLGRGRCPLCGSEDAKVSLSKNGLAVMTCMARKCGMQLFTRGDGADESVRALIVSEAPAPAKEAPAAAKPATPPTTEPPRQEKPFSWGFLGA